MNYQQATTQQLLTIAYHDPMAQIGDRIMAGAELKRRARRKHRDRVQYKIVGVYAK